MVDLESKLSDEEKSVMTKRSRITLEITGAALFSALSIVVGTFLTPTLTNLLRVPGWFIAIIDLISLIWVKRFFLSNLDSFNILSYKEWKRAGL